MTELLKGKNVSEAMAESMKTEVEILKRRGVMPTLMTMRIGERPDDISYERGVAKRCEDIGVRIERLVMPEDITQEELLEQIENVNMDKDEALHGKIHGILLFRPLPKHIDEDVVRNAIKPEKDVDGITDLSMAGVFTATEIGYPPCTPKACMEILDYYGIELKGKKVVVIGRSLVVGKPVAMMLLKKDATVTICHTKTEDIAAVARDADILIVAAGKAGAISAEYLRDGQIVIDVGINVNAEGKLCGDVNFDDAEPIVKAITPVPGGVGIVTTGVLVSHVIEAAKKSDRAM